MDNLHMIFWGNMIFLSLKVIENMNNNIYKKNLYEPNILLLLAYIGLLNY